MIYSRAIFWALLFRRAVPSASASISDGVRSTLTDRIFLLPAVGEGNSIGLSSPFGLGFSFAEHVNEPAAALGNTAELGLGLFFAASVSAPPNENSTIAQHTTFILDLRMAASFLSFAFAFCFLLGYEGVTRLRAF